MAGVPLLLVGGSNPARGEKFLKETNSLSACEGPSGLSENVRPGYYPRAGAVAEDTALHVKNFTGSPSHCCSMVEHLLFKETPLGSTPSVDTILRVIMEFVFPTAVAPNTTVSRLTDVCCGKPRQSLPDCPCGGSEAENRTLREPSGAALFGKDNFVPPLSMLVAAHTNPRS